MNPANLILLLLATRKRPFDDEAGLLIWSLVLSAQAQAQASQGSGTTTVATPPVSYAPLDPTTLLLLLVLGKGELFGGVRHEEGRAERARELRDDRLMSLVLALSGGQLSTATSAGASSIPAPIGTTTFDPTTLALLALGGGGFFREREDPHRDYRPEEKPGEHSAEGG